MVAELADIGADGGMGEEAGDVVFGGGFGIAGAEGSGDGAVEFDVETAEFGLAKGHGLKYLGR